MSTLTLSYQRYAGRSRQESMGRLIALLTGWYQLSRQRHQLAQLSDSQLRDIGVSRVEAQSEAAKAFWQS